MLNNRHAAIYYEPDGYVASGRRLMGRHSAGLAFLRAAVSARQGQELWCYTASQASAEIFAKQVKSINPSVVPRWCRSNRLDLLQSIGTLYFPGPQLTPLANLRLRRGADGFSLCGITHTTASHAAMDALTSTIHGPLMPWDAIICTSTAVAETIRFQRDAEQEYLYWRFGQSIKVPEPPQFPVIPLGVHASDYAISPGVRRESRARLKISDEHIVVLFVGRLSFHAKAHPDAMYLALEATARSSGKQIILIQCGWFENEALEQAFRVGAASAPSVRTLFLDGRDEASRMRAWASADIFLSLADNIQETFGLTPLEAMAAALPVIVTDWDGYKDTVQHGVEGFRVPTFQPAAGIGKFLAADYESGMISYDRYCGYSCQLVSVDHQRLVEHLSSLAKDPDLRRSMGQNGRKRALELYDWSVIYRAYGELWEELGSIRTAAASRAALAGAPAHAPARGDPLQSFKMYPSHHLETDTVISISHRSDGLDYEELLKHPLYSYAQAVLPDAKVAEQILIEVAKGPLSLEQLIVALGLSHLKAAVAAAALAKMGLVRLEPTPQ